MHVGLDTDFNVWAKVSDGIESNHFNKLYVFFPTSWTSCLDDASDS